MIYPAFLALNFSRMIYEIAEIAQIDISNAYIDRMPKNLDNNI
jgi:hypothetical protein